MARQIGYAVVGTDDVVSRGILPAFAHASENSRLVAVIAADRIRAQTLGQEFRAAAYTLDEFKQCLQRDDINAVYIALSNALHSDYTVEAARAGTHVLCEAPMAMTADECRRMLRTCHTNRVKLMIAYRLHRHPAHVKALELARSGQIGTPKTFSSDVTTRIGDPDDPRLQRRLGGGTVFHLGVACINTARLLFGEEPAQVMAMTARMSRRYGGDVDEEAVALIRFPGERLAHFHTAFGEEASSGFTLFGDEGYLHLENAYRHDHAMTLEVVRNGQRQEIAFEPSDQFAREIAFFSTCILLDQSPEPTGAQGLQDVRIVEAIYRSARDGRPVTLPPISRVEAAPAPEAARYVQHKRQAS